MKCGWTCANLVSNLIADAIDANCMWIIDFDNYLTINYLPCVSCKVRCTDETKTLEQSSPNGKSFASFPSREKFEAADESSAAGKEEKFKSLPRPSSDLYPRFVFSLRAQQILGQVDWEIFRLFVHSKIWHLLAQCCGYWSGRIEILSIQYGWKTYNNLRSPHLMAPTHSSNQMKIMRTSWS